MNRFLVTSEPLGPQSLRNQLLDPASGAYVQFEGWVRDHNDGRRVLRLEYEVYEPLAIKEGERIIAEAVRRFSLRQAAAIHRSGLLQLTDIAVLVGVSSPHRGEAFDACRYIIDRLKTRLPIWKKEHYADGTEEWVNCLRCAEAGHRHGT